MRPIILLECLRKLFVRVINTRLSNICVNNNILKGLNFAGLPGGTTKTPIHILNNLLEDARDNHKQIWIAMQDMSKAFDSVGMVLLTFALKRIKLPQLAIDFFINLFKDRNMRIITNFGLSDAFTAKDGIDQGEVCSLLIWRIFYDSLLCRIQNDPTLGYTTAVTWPDTNPNRSRVIKSRIAGLAFADDTLWIGHSQSNLQRIIDISNSFFLLNDIEINGNKSKLMVINPPANQVQATVTMGTKRPEKVLFEHPKELVRYLGVWFSAHNSKKSQLHIIKQEMEKIVAVIRYKSITIDQMVYINNKVLIPRLEYRLSTTLLSEEQARIVYSPVTKAAKKAMGLASTTQTNKIGRASCRERV